MPTPRAARALRRAAAAAVLVVLALAATAPAATLSESLNGGLNYTAAFGERNDLKLRQTGDLVIVEDIVPIRESHPRCITTSSGAIGCSRLPIGATARVQLLDGDDVFTGAALVPTEVIAGGGNDRYVAGRAPGISRVSFDAGADTGDVVDFSTANGPSVLHAEDVAANDGRGFDKDLVKGVERVVGSPFGDTLIGSEAGETFAPGGGDDTVETRGGADLVDMGSVRDGADRIVGDIDDVVSYRLRTQPLLVIGQRGHAQRRRGLRGRRHPRRRSVRGWQGQRHAGRRPAAARPLHRARGRLRRRHPRRRRGRGPPQPGPGRRHRARPRRAWTSSAPSTVAPTTSTAARATTCHRRRARARDHRAASASATSATAVRPSAWPSRQADPHPADAAVDAGGRPRSPSTGRTRRAWRKLRRLDVTVLDGRKVIAGVAIAPGPRRIRSRGAGVSLLTAHGVVARKGRSASARLRLSVPRRLAGRCCASTSRPSTPAAAGRSSASQARCRSSGEHGGIAPGPHVKGSGA